MNTSYSSLRTARRFLVVVALLFSLFQGAAPSHAATNITYTVNTTADPGPDTCTAAVCSLHRAMLAAYYGSASYTYTILFKLPYPATITLSGSLPAVINHLTITGPGRDSLVIDGGGHRVFTVNSAGYLTLTGLAIQHGSDPTRAGGILVDGGALAMNGCLLADNSTSNEVGGLANDGGTVSIDNTILSGNTGWHYGAIYNTGKMTINNSLVSDSLARLGGGITNVGSLTITNSTLTRNDTSQTPGGAISNGGVLVIANSTFDNNGAIQGGDIVNGGSSASVHITNSTFASADLRSGSSIETGGGATLTIRNSLLAAGTSIANCLVLPGTPDSAVNVDSSNLSTDTTCGAAVVKPLAELELGPLQNNGGITPTIALLPGSAAIDAGDDAACAAPVGAPNYGAGGKDQRGFPRPFGDHCDAGAFEFSPLDYQYLPIIVLN